jgi:hypothetical protein
VAGVFLFLPLLARLRFDDLVTQAGYPGSGMIPPPAALLSLLTLKLLDKERRSHITAFDVDEALGLFASLNVLPKKSYATDYSYRTTRPCQQGLLSRWVAALAPLLFPDAQEFCLDFHAIPFRGEPEAAENHYLPMRGKAAPSILSFVAYEPQSRVLCDSNADLTRADQAEELMRFVDFWRDRVSSGQGLSHYGGQGEPPPRGGLRPCVWPQVPSAPGEGHLGPDASRGPGWLNSHRESGSVSDRDRHFAR